MKKIAFYLGAGILVLLFVAAFKPKMEGNFENGSPEIKSISALTFGPDGVLFIGDSKSAVVFAIETKDTKARKKATPVEIKNIDQKIAAALGTGVANITITDMAVNPISKKLYVGVHSADGTPVLLQINGDKIELFALANVTFSAVAINNAPAVDAKDQRGRSLRVNTISDLGFADGKLLVSGLSNHQFSSNFKSIPYPFTGVQDEATLEIYHAAHGRYETSAPVRTFTTAAINGKQYVVASYTCTPLVLFPMDELKPGMHVKGRTVAEMGSGNTPVDMLTLTKDGMPYLVMANTARPVSKVDYKSINAFEGMLTEKVNGKAGVTYTEAPALTNVLQMDKLDDGQVVILQKKAGGEIDLWTANDTNL